MARTSLQWEAGYGRETQSDEEGKHLCVCVSEGTHVLLKQTNSLRSIRDGRNSRGKHVPFLYDLRGFREIGNHLDIVEDLRSPYKQRKRLNVSTSLSFEKLP